MIRVLVIMLVATGCKARPAAHDDAAKVRAARAIDATSVWPELATFPHVEPLITERHGVSAEQFEVAWMDRVDLLVRPDDAYESLGATDDGREL